MAKTNEHNRRDEILAAAIEIMMEHGHASLSMDKVARKLGISKGNITYHFPSKQIFVQSVFERLLQESQQDRQVQLDPYVGSLEERLRLKLQREFEILCQPDYDTRAWETLAYSTQDPNVGQAFEELFGWLIDDVVGVIAPLRPDLSKQQLADLGLYLIAISRGMIVFVGSARNHPRRDVLVQQAIEQMMDTVRTWPPGSRRKGDKP